MATTSQEVLQELQNRILQYAPPPITNSTADCMTAAREWGRLFCELGGRLREQGKHRYIRTVTVGRPMDLVAIQVLQLACSDNGNEDGSEVVTHLAEMLADYLFEGKEAMSRFQSSLGNVLRRLLMFEI